MFRRILHEARPYRWPIVAVFLLSLLATPLALLGPVPLKIAVDSVLGTDPLPWFLGAWLPPGLQQSTTGLLLVAAVLQVLLVLLIELQVFATAVLKTYVSEKLTLRFRARLLSHIQRLSFGFHDARGTADSIYRIQNDAPAIQRVVVNNWIPLSCDVITLGAMIVVMARIDWHLAFVGLAITPLLYASARSFRRRYRPVYQRAKQLESRALGVVQEVLTSFRVVKAYGRESRESERFADHSAQSVQTQIELAFAEGAFGTLVRVTTAAGTAVVLFLGVRNVMAGVLTLGELLMVLAYLGQLFTPLRTISKSVANMQKELASARRAFELLDELPEVTDRPNALPLVRAKGAVAFKNVSFGYDGRPSVLQDVSFDLPAGARLGIVGVSGVGKTTLVSLISRFYDPIEGQILLDGIDLRAYRLADLRNQFAIMLQEPVLFATSIGENIAYARPGASHEEVVAASRAAFAHEFVEGLPDGYETLVGERGMMLSGGERQRISLARAFLKDAPLLILDEPTSAIDTKTEALILEALEHLMRGRTTIMIAHKPSTLDRCDLMLRMEPGRIAFGPR